ncbi:MAG: NAD-dependent epimerase/dehydratase family protein [Hyphomicrobium sp.]|uniref:NAD-dependent epimerase/dehydratase family protein n=1 Tax=Hyphomicrobium sp. TaxID=82 RepID=UPI003D1204C8
MGRILVTGSSGFVGGHVARRLLAAGFALSLAGRGKVAGLVGDVRRFDVGPLNRNTDWREALAGCDAVIHLAAQAPAPGVPDEAFDEANDRGTERLVVQARQSPAKVFVLVSSALAVADHASREPLSEQTPPKPESAYGRSKLKAERHLATFVEPGRGAVALRPPIVYGQGARGNWRLLQRLAASGVPLPFGGVDNRRTVVAVENIADAIVHVLGAREVPGRLPAYMISDGRAVSLRQMLTWLRQGMGLPPRLFPVPASLLAGALSFVGKARIAGSLLGDMEVLSSQFERDFAWMPVIDTEAGIRQSGVDFRAERRT